MSRQSKYLEAYFIQTSANYPPSILANNFKEEKKNQSYVPWLNFIPFTNKNIHSIKSRRILVRGDLIFERRKGNKEILDSRH